MASQLCTLAVAPVLTRLFAPADFGVLAVYTSLLSLVLAVACLRLEVAIPLAEDDAAAARLAVAGLGGTLVAGLLVEALVWAFDPAAAALTGATAPAGVLRLLGLGVVVAGWTQVAAALAIRQERYAPLARARLAQGCSQAMTQLTLGVVAAGPWGLVVGDTAGRAVGCAAQARGLLRACAVVRAERSAAAFGATLRRYRRFPLVSTWSALLNAAGLYGFPVLLAASYGAQAAGEFALAQRVVGLPLGLVATAVAPVYLGRAARTARQRGDLRSLLTTSAGRLVLVGALPALLFLLAGGPLFALAFGPSWHEAGRFAQAMAGMFLLQFVAVPTSQTLNVLERQGVQLAWDALRLGSIVAGLVAVHASGGTAYQAVQVYAGTMALCYLLLLAASYGATASGPAAPAGAVARPSAEPGSADPGVDHAPAPAVPLRIAYVAQIEASVESGAGKKMAAQIAEWRRLGHDVQLFTMGHTGGSWTGWGAPAPVVLVHHGLVDHLLVSGRLVARVLRWRPDVIYYRMGWCTPPFWYMADRVPTVVEANSDDEAESRVVLGKVRGPLYRALRRRMLRRVRGFVPVSAEIARSLAVWGKPMHTIANGTRLGNHPPVAVRTDDRPRLVFVGTAGMPWHGIDKILWLAERCPDWRFDLVGIDPGDLGQAPPPNLTAHGYLQEDGYRRLLAYADVAIGTLALHRKGMSEASPLKVREYLACGLPVVTGFSDTDFPTGAPFILELPNTPDNVMAHLGAIHSFVRAWRGRRVARADIARLDLREKERVRLAFLGRISRGGGA